MASLRIVGGILAGRIIQAPRGATTHPMSERLRSALFNSLGELSQLKVLDAFGGSGALGIEAVSRGATDVVIIERDRQVFDYLNDNVALLNLDANVRISRANCYSWLKANKLSFDLILADPPYQEFNPDQLVKLAGYLNSNGLLVISAPSDQEFKFKNLRLVQRRTYGNASLHYWRKT